MFKFPTAAEINALAMAPGKESAGGVWFTTSARNGNHKTGYTGRYRRLKNAREYFLRHNPLPENDAWTPLDMVTAPEAVRAKYREILRRFGTYKAREDRERAAEKKRMSESAANGVALEASLKAEWTAEHGPEICAMLSQVRSMHFASQQNDAHRAAMARLERKIKTAIEGRYAVMVAA
jgi:4-hydroxyphenylpyruvate dioxygenase-like putative hemolysin